MRKKNGFTLIELLAVILILGIIALIAIPTVTSVVEQARKGAFESTVKNLVKAAETKCRMEQLNGDKITNTYIISNGEIDHELDLKGSYPDSASIFLNDSCDVSIFASNDKYYIYRSREENDYVTNENKDRPIYDIINFSATANAHTQLQTVTSTSAEGDPMFHNTLYADKIISVSFVNGIDYSSSVAYWDMTRNETGKVFAWINSNGEYYDLYIGSNGIITPTNLNNEFGLLTAVKEYRFDNLDTSMCTTMNYTFSANSSVEKLDLTSFNLPKLETMNSTFNDMTSLKEIILGEGFECPKLTKFGQTFRRDRAIEKIDLHYIKSKKITNIGYTFDNCTALKEIDMSNIDFTSVIYIDGAFTSIADIQNIYVNETWHVPENVKTYINLAKVDAIKTSKN